MQDPRYKQESLIALNYVILIMKVAIIKKYEIVDTHSCLNLS